MSARLQLAILIACAYVPLAGCSGNTTTTSDPQLGILWVRNAAEFEALCLQAYRAAGDFLESALADKSWSALPDQHDAEALPPAIIFDVDETADYQRRLPAHTRTTFSQQQTGRLECGQQSRGNSRSSWILCAPPRTAGVELFFVTNRPCELKPGIDDPCPQQTVTMQDLVEAGIPADLEHMSCSPTRGLAGTREKSTRRNAHRRDTSCHYAGG